MHIVMVIVGLVFMVFGVGAFFGGRSAIHEIEGITAFGFGVVFIGISAALGHLRELRHLTHLQRLDPELRQQLELRAAAEKAKAPPIPAREQERYTGL